MSVNIMLNRPKHLTSLATSGILVSVDITAWTGTKQDRGISDEITSAKKADKDSGRFIKHLLANDPDHKRLLNHRQTVYNWLRRRTYPWDAGQQYLPTISIPTFMQEFAVLQREYTNVPGTLLNTFLTKYPAIVSNMAFVQGDMFNRADYPTVKQIESKFHMELYTSEVPANDFRNLVAEDLAEDLYNTYSRQAEERVDSILSEQARQFITVMESISKCCTTELVTDPNTGEAKLKRKKIYDTTIERALELCNIFEQFNLTENPHLEQARRSLSAALNGISIEGLRESDSLREQVKHDVDDILSKFRPMAPAADEDEEEGEQDE